MGFVDSVQEAIEAGAEGAQRFVSSIAIERLGFMRGFIRMCADGWDQGWHERNGGNASYRLTNEDTAAAKPFFRTPSPWVSMGVQADNLKGAYFLTTASGSYMRNIADAPSKALGIVEIDETGSAWRKVWGFDEGGMPTSEFESHFINQSVRMAAGDDCRVVYHAHPVSIIALSAVLPLSSRAFSRALWKAMSECVMAFPEGVGVVPFMVPGGPEIAEATAQQMVRFRAVIWALHGMFVAGETFDSTFGLFHVIEKAARIYNEARLLNGGSDAFPNTISDEGLRQIAERVGVTINEEFLD